MSRELWREYLIASYCTLSGAGVGQPAGFTFAERVAAAAFSALGMQLQD